MKGVIPVKWLRDMYTDNFVCPYCGSMVPDNGYGSCDYKYCPHCSREIEPEEDAQ
jgi:DNA-directed RNA polymerase subunit RPC12/RpoP